MSDQSIAMHARWWQGMTGEERLAYEMAKGE